MKYCIVFAAAFVPCLLASVAEGQAVVTYYQPTTTYYAPAPAATYYAPAVAAPVATFSAPAAVTPVTTYYTTTAVPVVSSRAVIVRPKVYVRGQPIRNVLRAITP